MIMLSDLRALLERAIVHAAEPAILRLSERTVEGVARAYLARTVWVAEARPGLSALRCSVGVIGSRMRTVPLDLTDPGTAHALTVALALAHGLDPGPMGCGVAWCAVEGGFQLSASRVCVRYLDAEHPHGWYGRVVFAPAVATERDPVKALALAVRHVLEAL